MEVNKHMLETYMSLDREDIAAFDTPTLHDALQSLAGKCLELQAEIDRLRAYKADVEETARVAAEEDCDGERHCTCVPLLRLTVKEQHAEIDRLRKCCDEIEADREYNFRLVSERDAEIEQLRGLINDSAFHVSPCSVCGEDVLCVPEGGAMCRTCAARMADGQ